MDLKHLLTKDRSSLLKLGLKKIGKTEEDLVKDVDILRDWLKSQQHLPEIPNDNIITNFLFINKFGIEITKQKLDMYYTIRRLVPEFFQNKNPRLPHMKLIADVSFVIPLPKTTEDGYRVTVFQIKSDDPEKFDMYDFFGHSYNIAEVRINEDVAVGDVLIYDFGNLKMGHVTKITPVVVKKSSVVLEKVFSNRLKQIHCINCAPYTEAVITLVKSLLKPKLARRMFAHKDTCTISEYIPLEILPSDFGGKELALHELNELWKKKLLQYQDRFDALDAMKINEELRPTPLVNDEVLGFHGNFKKLDLD